MWFLVKITVVRRLSLCFNSVGINMSVAVYNVVRVNVMVKRIRTIWTFML